MPYIYSTATAPQRYVSYKRVTKDLNQIERSVLIKGGANAADKKHMITPYGVATQVSEDDMQFLMDHPTFKRHMEKGFMRVSKSKKDPEQVITSTKMETRDGSAPETPETLEAKGAKLKEL